LRKRCYASDGFTFIELVIALILGVMVLGAAMAFVIQEMRSLAGREIRESLSRNGRYIGVSVRHDLQRAGIEISSTMSFGSLAVWPGATGDTLVILHVPYKPDVAPPHSLIPPAGDDNPLPPGGTCGSRCLDLAKLPPDVTPLELQPGNLARLQIPGQRHLILVEQINVTGDSSFQLTFTPIDTVLRQPASMSGGLQLDRFSTFVQAVKPIMYYLDDEEQLMRAARLNFDGSPVGHVLAYGVEEFQVSFVFADGDESDRADPFDADDSNDFDDIVAVTVRVTLRADRADPRLNSGELLRRNYQWTVSPRNLRYEKART
jgi:hypothetical protein